MSTAAQDYESELREENDITTDTIPSHRSHVEKAKEGRRPAKYLRGDDVEVKDPLSRKWKAMYIEDATYNTDIDGKGGQGWEYVLKDPNNGDAKMPGKFKEKELRLPK